MRATSHLAQPLQSAHPVALKCGCEHFSDARYHLCCVRSGNCRTFSSFPLYISSRKLLQSQLSISFCSVSNEKCWRTPEVPPISTLHMLVSKRFRLHLKGYPSCSSSLRFQLPDWMIEQCGQLRRNISLEC